MLVFTKTIAEQISIMREIKSIREVTVAPLCSPGYMFCPYTTHPWEQKKDGFTQPVDNIWSIVFYETFNISLCK